MASKAGQPEADKVDIEEALEMVDKTLERTKLLYEQYFLGMQKQPPTQVHTEVERRLRDLQQLQIRNTGMRYRFATLQQKFGSYNSYWRRTLKQIENGTYIRNLQKISRKAALTGDVIPEEILAAMPKRMREQVKRDREQALAIARRRQGTHDDGTDEWIDDASAAIVGEAPAVARQIPRGGAHVLAGDEADLDFEAFFASVGKADDTQESAPAYVEKPLPTRSPAPAAAHPRAPVLQHELSYEDDELTSFEAAPAPRGTGSVPSAPQHSRAAIPGPTGPVLTPRPTASTAAPAQRPTGPVPVVPAPAGTGQTQSIPRRAAAQRMPGDPGRPTGGAPAPSQLSKPNPIAPGSSSARASVPVETLAGPFPRAATPPVRTAGPPVNPRQAPPIVAPPRAQDPAQRPPPGMNDADVNALYATYVKAKQAVGEEAGPGAYGKLLKTINAQAPKIMEQYKAKGVEFSVVVKDNQVVIKAKPKP